MLKIGAKFCTFWSPVNIKGWAGNMSKWIWPFWHRTKPIIYFDRALLGRLGDYTAGVIKVQRCLSRPSDISLPMSASINEDNLHQARLVLRWATVSGFNFRCRTLISVCNQPATQCQLSLIRPGSVNEYSVPASAGRHVWFIPLTDERGVCM